MALVAMACKMRGVTVLAVLQLLRPACICITMLPAVWIPPASGTTPGNGGDGSNGSGEPSAVGRLELPSQKSCSGHVHQYGVPRTASTFQWCA